MKHKWRKILKRKALLLKIVIPTVSTVSLATILLGMVFLFPHLPFSTTDQFPSLTEDHRAAIRIDLFAEGLSHPTSMAFADNATLLVLEKDIGNIRKITDGLLEKEPVLQVNVNNTAERGLLGKAVLREDKRESKDSKAILSNDYMSSTAGSSLNTMLTSSLSSYCNCSFYIYFTQESEVGNTCRIQHLFKSVYI